MITPILLDQCQTYLQFVDRGDVSDVRSEAHNCMMDTMRIEGFIFADRDDARELARALVIVFEHFIFGGGIAFHAAEQTEEIQNV